MPSTMTYQPGDLLLIGFPFSGGSQVKTRPAMVVLDSGDADVVVPVSQHNITQRPLTFRSHIGKQAVCSLHPQCGSIRPVPSLTISRNHGLSARSGANECNAATICLVDCCKK